MVNIEGTDNWVTYLSYSEGLEFQNARNDHFLAYSKKSIFKHNFCYSEENAYCHIKNRNLNICDLFKISLGTGWSPKAKTHAEIGLLYFFFSSK